MVTPPPKRPQRADKILKELFPTLTGRHIEEALESGLVTQLGKKLKKGAYTFSESLDTSCLKDHLEKLRRGNELVKLSVLAETPDEWIVDKPSGMVSQPLSLFDTETPTHWALSKEPSLSQEFEEVQPVLSPHRLDRGTSGLLIVCRNKLSFQKWRQAFEKKEVKKKYLAWCWGNCSSSELTISDPIGHDTSDVRKMVVVSQAEMRFRPPLLEASTRAKLLKRKGEFSLWEIECSTGVTHQVRVHLASRGLPLVGDSLYAPQAPKGSDKEFHCLRAFELVWKDQTYQLSTDEFEKGP